MFWLLNLPLEVTTTIDISLVKASYLLMPHPKVGKKCHPGKRLEKYLK